MLYPCERYRSVTPPDAARVNRMIFHNHLPYILGREESSNTPRKNKIGHHLRLRLLISGVFLVVGTKLITPKKCVPWCWGKLNIFGCTGYV